MSQVNEMAARFHAVAVGTAALLRRRAILVGVSLIVVAVAGWSPVAGGFRFIHDVDAVTDAGDDWLAYHENAVDILDHGLSMPSLRETYSMPGGFLYNYFVAAVYATLGRNAAYVYWIQGMLLAMSLVLFYVAGRDHLSPEAGLLFPLVTAAALYRGFYADLTFRLLSENLAIPLIAVATIYLLRARVSRSLAPLAISGVLIGAVVLTRPHLQLAPLAAAGLVVVYSRGSLRSRFIRGAVLLAGALAALALLAFRNWTVTGHFTTMSARYNSIVATPSAFGWGGLLQVYLQRTLYCVGVFVGGLDMKGSSVDFNKYLLVASAGALGQVVRSVVRRRLDFVDAVALMWIGCSSATFIGIPSLGAYGMRFQWITLPLMIFLAVRFLDAVVQRVRGRAASPAVAREEI